MWRKLLFFGTLYFVQGAAFAYVINFQKPYLAGRGVSKETLGIFTSLLLIPFILKVLLGYISDRYPIGRFGSRKPYIVLGLSTFMISYGAIAFIDPGESFALFATLTMFASFGLAWFDACADGWAVDVAQEHEESAIQAAMISGRALGTILTASGLGVLALQHGFRAIFLGLALLALFVLAVILFAKPAERSVRKQEYIHGWRDVFQGFYLCFLLFAVVYCTASLGTDGLLTLHFSESIGFQPLQIGYFGSFRGLGALGGALAFGVFGARLGLGRAQYLAITMLAAGCLLPLIEFNVFAKAACWGFVWGFQEVSFLTVAMRLAQGRLSATLFAFSMIFANIGNALGEALGAPLVPRIGYQGVFGGFALIALLSVAFLPPVFSSLRRRS